MKYLLFILLCLPVLADTPSSQLPLKTSFKDTDCIVSTDPLNPDLVKAFRITWASTFSQVESKLLSDTNFINSIATNTNLINTLISELLTNNAFTSNLLSELITNNANTTNILALSSSNSLFYCPFDFSQIMNLNTQVAVQAVNTNIYWVDFGKTNAQGQTNVFAELTATNDILFNSATNNIRGSELSFGVIAQGANRTIYFTKAISSYFDTNGWSDGGSAWVMVLTNGNLWRISLQQRSVMETMQKRIGQ